MIGKTNTDEFAMGSSTENSAFGPSRNPWDPTRVPGGSGGGTAAAVSGGLAPWGLGSDTGGSIKQPSALCGNVGLRPTYGTVSRYGIVAFASSLDQIGPVAKTVRDVALLYSIIAGRDENDSTTVELPEPSSSRRGDARGLRIGIPTQVWDLPGIEPGVRASFEAAIETARALGAEIGECDLPLSFDYGLAVLLPDRTRRGIVEPRAVRRCSLRAAGRRADLSRDGRADARRRLRRRAEAADHARHVRAVGRLLRRLLRAGAAGANAADPRAPRGAREVRRDRDADLADGRVPDRRPGRRPARDVRVRRDDDPVVPRGPAGAQHPLGLSRGLPSACS